MFHKEFTPFRFCLIFQQASWGYPHVYVHSLEISPEFGAKLYSNFGSPLFNSSLPLSTLTFQLLFSSESCNLPLLENGKFYQCWRLGIGQHFQERNTQTLSSLYFFLQQYFKSKCLASYYLLMLFLQCFQKFFLIIFVQL